MPFGQRNFASGDKSMLLNVELHEMLNSLKDILLLGVDPCQMLHERACEGRAFVVLGHRNLSRWAWQKAPARLGGFKLAALPYASVAIDDAGLVRLPRSAQNPR